MLFEVHATAMDGAEGVLDALDQILGRVEDDVHEMAIVDADQIEASRWYQSSRSDRRKMVDEIARVSMHRSPRSRGPHAKKADVTDEDSAACAERIALTPLLVLAENDVSDGALIEAALRTFGARETLHLCFGPPSKLDPPSFQIESRGGHGELKKLIEKRLEDANERGRPARLVVVTDSDGEWVGDVKDHALAIRGQCAGKGIPCPPLNKRTAENYIPDGVWRAWAALPEHTSARPAVDALLRLSPAQRDHVNMDKGAPWNPANINAAALFQAPSVSAADEALLQQANLKGKGNTMVILALRSHPSTPGDLSARDQNGDLKNLVRNIEDEL